MNTAVKITLPDGRETRFETLAPFVIAVQTFDGRWSIIDSAASALEAEAMIAGYTRFGNEKTFQVIPVEQPARPDYERLFYAAEAMHRAAVIQWGIQQANDRRPLQDDLYKSWRGYINVLLAAVEFYRALADGGKPRRFIY